MLCVCYCSCLPLALYVVEHRATTITQVRSFCRIAKESLSDHYSLCSVTHQRSVSLWYRNQAVDLLWKSIDWFLYEWNTYHSWVVKILFVLSNCTREIYFWSSNNWTERLVFEKDYSIVTKVKVKTVCFQRLKNSDIASPSLNPLTTNAPHHIETSQSICNVIRLTGFYMARNICR